MITPLEFLEKLEFKFFKWVYCPISVDTRQGTHGLSLTIEKRQSLNELSESIPYIIEYMRKKNFKAVVEFILLCPDTVASFVMEEYEKSIVQLGNGRIRQVKRIAIKGIEAVHKSLTAYLNHRRTGKTLFAVEKNTTSLSYMLQGAGFYKAIPHRKKCQIPPSVI